MLSALLSHALFSFFCQFDRRLARTDSIPLTWKTTDPWTAQSNGNAGNADTNSASPAGWMCCLMGKWKNNLIAPATYGDSVNRTPMWTHPHHLHPKTMPNDKSPPEPETVAQQETGGDCVSRLIRRVVFFTMVYDPRFKGWTRTGKAYTSRKTAREWVPFVRAAWRGCRTKVCQCTLTWHDGKLTPKSVKVLDEKFNMDAPDSSTNAKCPPTGGNEV